MAEAPKTKSAATTSAGSDARPAAPAGQGGWLPVIAVIVLVPVLSFATAEFLLFPRLEKRLAASGIATGAPGHESHGPASTGANASGSKGAAIHFYEFRDIISNLAGSMNSRYIKVSFTAYSADPKISEIVTANRAKLLDAALSVLGRLTVADIEDPAVKDRVKNELVQAFQATLGGRVIEEIYFSEFVRQ